MTTLVHFMHYHEGFQHCTAKNLELHSFTYSSVLNRRVGQRNVQVGKFLKNIKRADQNKAVQRVFFLKINKCAGQIPIQVQDGINLQGEYILKNNKRADQNKAVQGGIFSKNQ